ncbi:MAG: mechanosensitive ion channel family protein [Anaerolineae bacterium]|nr:mechanosensitive ion channel family protein [Anaerolineae bacterium]
MSDVVDRLYVLLVDLLVAIPRVIVALIVIVIIYLLSGFVKRSVILFLRRGRRKLNVSLLLGRLAQAGVIVSGLLVSLTIALPSFEPSQLIGLVGIASVAIGFAFRDFLQDMVAGILLLLNEPFSMGDQITVGAFEGTVEEIKTSFTYITTYDNRRVVIPNGDLYTVGFTVNTAYRVRRSEFDVQLIYEDDAVAAQELMLSVLKETEGVLVDPPPDTLLVSMNETAVVIRIRWWTTPIWRDMQAVRDRVLRRVKTQLTEQGYTLPAPIRAVVWDDLPGKHH